MIKIQKLSIKKSPSLNESLNSQDLLSLSNTHRQLLNSNSKRSFFKELSIE